MTLGTHEAQDIQCVVGVLVGGGSRRMGTPKHLIATADGRTLIERTIAIAAPAAHEVVILGSQSVLPGAVNAHTVLPDVVAGGGPLAGLCSLLQHAGSRWALLLACDMPFIETGLLRRLLAAVCDDADAVAFEADTRRGLLHACCALYHSRILPTARDGLTNNNASLQALLRRVRTTSLATEAAESAQLTNVNTPEELADALGENR